MEGEARQAVRRTAGRVGHISRVEFLDATLTTTLLLVLPCLWRVGKQLEIL